jgi:nucleotide-binding universal stress UspA family protein
MDSEYTTERPRIVVGIDGLEPSMAALRWAIHQARLTGAVVEAVTAWHIPVGTGWLPAADMPDYQEDAFDVLAEAIGQMYVIDPDAEVCPRVIKGQAGQVLVNAAEGADLLVVGCRGHGGLGAAVLGSVSQFCAHHAPCPVVIMRGKPALYQRVGVLADLDPGRGVGRCAWELAYGGVGSSQGTT